jgi:hypothetical protein
MYIFNTSNGTCMEQWTHLQVIFSSRVTRAWQAKLTIALELGEATGDKGYTLGQGPPCSSGETPSQSAHSGSVADEKTALGVSRTSAQSQVDLLQHSAAQVCQALVATAFS